MRTYKLAAERRPARHGHGVKRPVHETGPGGTTVCLLVDDSSAIDTVEALTRAYFAGREDADAERAVWWESPIGLLVQAVVMRPDAEQVLRRAAAQHDPPPPPPPEVVEDAIVPLEGGEFRIRNFRPDGWKG